MQRLTAALATADFHAQRLGKVAQEPPSQPAGAAAAEAASELLHWVNLASDAITNVLQLMDATAGSSNGNSGSSAKAGAARNGPGSPGPLHAAAALALALAKDAWPGSNRDQTAF